MRTRTLAALLATLALLLAGCSGTADEQSDDQTLTVYAAASLKDTFTALGKTFESQHPGTTVQFTFGGSSALVAQLDQGAPADVFASADQANMTKAVQAEVIDGDPVPFATNTLEIATAPGNPQGIADLSDLTGSDVQLVVCAPEVPCGAATTKVAQLAGVTLSPVSEESSVTDVLTKVETGQADAGLVYRTDVKAAGDKVTGVSFAQADQVVNDYPIAKVARTGARTQLAADFVTLVTSEAGQQVLADAGFGAPAS